MITAFEEGKSYVMNGTGRNWSDYDGPFTSKEAIQHLASLCSEWTSPELLNSVVVVKFENNKLDLVKSDSGSPINGYQIYWKNTITVGGEIIWQHV